MNEPKQIIVTLTSWRGRIDIVGDTIKSILNNTLVPDKIVLNLSEDEFPGKENDLPGNLISLFNEHVNCEIHWVKENNRQFKKLIPTLKRYPNDAIISIDDDIIYNENFVSTLYNDFKKNRFQHPVSTWENTTMTNNVYGKLVTHSGQGSITMAKFYGHYLTTLYDELVVEKLTNKVRVFDDALYTYSALLNGTTYRLVSTKFSNLVKRQITTNNGISSDNEKELLLWHNDLRNFIVKRFGKIFVKGFGFKGVSQEEAKGITFIMPNRGGDRVNDVINNFRETFKGYFNDVRFIVIEQCDDDIFKKGQLFNIAFLFSDTPFLALIDNDIYNMDSFDIVKKYEEFGGPYLAFDEITQIKLDESPSDKYRILFSEKRLSGFGAFQVMKREDFVRANGFSNLCFGWGAEDDIFNYRIKFQRWCHKLGHINHPRRVNLHPDATKNNRRVFGLHKSGAISSEKDSYIYTTYNLVRDDKIGDVEYLGVNSISVAEDYPYKNEYNTAIKSSKIGLVNASETVFVTLTSWKARIGNIPKVLDSILKQSKQPDKIILNLSSEEFSNKELDIPKVVIDYINKNNKIEINWVDGVNTKQWKKIIPTLLKYPEVWTICIDDDRLYPSNFISTLWETHVEHPNSPITLNRTYKINGYLQHAGIGTLECAKLYNHFNGIDFNYIRQNTESSDTVFTYLLNKNGYELVPVKTNVKLTSYNDVNALSKTVKTCSSQYIKDAWKMLEGKYGVLNRVTTVVPQETSNSDKKKIALVNGTPQASTHLCSNNKKRIVKNSIIPAANTRRIKTNGEHNSHAIYNETTKINNATPKPENTKVTKNNTQQKTIQQGTRVLKYVPSDSVTQQKIETHSRKLFKTPNIRKSVISGSFFR